MQELKIPALFVIKLNLGAPTVEVQVEQMPNKQCAILDLTVSRRRANCYVRLMHPSGDQVTLGYSNKPPYKKNLDTAGADGDSYGDCIESQEKPTAGKDN